MKFSLWTDNGALNSKPIFDAFTNSLFASGHTVTYNDYDSDVAVIWSVLWHGRMAGNQKVWHHFRALNKPVIVLEVGGIQRGTTWKVGLNGINRDAYFGPDSNDDTRVLSLGLTLKPWRTQGEHILLCAQHDKSLQWVGMPVQSKWVIEAITTLQAYSKRPIIFRPHPRCPLPNIEHEFKNVYREQPKKLSGTYDDFDMQFNNAHATLSYSSNPGVHSIINGIPAFVGTASLAYDASNDIDFLHDIENPFMPDRTQWLNDYAHTEWTVQEISQGTPIKLLTSKL
jgi:hypothetical protein